MGNVVLALNEAPTLNLEKLLQHGPAQGILRAGAPSVQKRCCHHKGLGGVSGNLQGAELPLISQSQSKSHSVLSAFVMVWHAEASRYFQLCAKASLEPFPKWSPLLRLQRRQPLLLVLKAHCVGRQ